MDKVIKSLLSLKGDTQSDMAKAIGISIVSLNMKINGKREFTCSEMGRISKYFGKPVQEIFFKE